MGAVYEALNRWTGRKVALKLMLSSHAQHPEQIERFLREARAASRLTHPHIVQVLDVGRQPDGSFFLIQELLDGRSLKDLLDVREQLSPNETRALLLPVLQGLASAHGNGVVHRDLKPDNLFVVERGVPEPIVKVIDFGIAKLTEHDGESLSVTRTGTAIGTPLYMSPEQARGERSVGAQSDIWSMGVVLFECLTGQCPFVGESYNEVLAKILTTRAPRLDQLAPGMPSDLCDVIAQALEPDRERRFRTMESFAEAVRRCEGFALERIFKSADADVSGAFASAVAHEAPTLDAREAPLLSRPSLDAATAHPSSEALTIDARGALSSQHGPPPASPHPPPPANTARGALEAHEPPPQDEPSKKTAIAGTPARAATAPAGTISGVEFAPAQTASKRKPAASATTIAAVLALSVSVAGLAILSRGRSATHNQDPSPRTIDPRPPSTQPAQESSAAAPTLAMPFSVAISVDPPNAMIEVDGRAVGVGAFAGNFLADHRTHTIRVSAAGYEPQTIEFRDGPPPPRVQLARSAQRSSINTRPPGARGSSTATPSTATSPAHGATQTAPRGPMQREYE
jgi:serine/threonine protein kinase